MRSSPGRPGNILAVSGILDAIGRTPWAELRRVVPGGSARVLVKLESHNPTGSMKDRMALAVVGGGASSGRLAPGGTVVEYTGGSTGTSLAFVCAAMGYPITLVTSDAFSREKRDHMRALGATVIELPSEGGRTTRELIQRMMARAAELAAAPGAFYADQFRNPDAAEGYAPLADELWEQSGGRLDAFVQSVGTAQCLTGVATGFFAGSTRGIRIVAVEPEESPVLSGGEPRRPRTSRESGLASCLRCGSPPSPTRSCAVSTAEARDVARRLAREEAIFAGTSSGANVAAALRVAGAPRRRAGPWGLSLCDSGLKYLSTDLYSSGS